MTASWRRLRPQVLRRVRPSAAETRRAQKAAREVVEASRRAARRFGHEGKPLVVGSIAKGTHLRPRPDIDVFVLLPMTVPREELERLGLAIGRRVLKRPKLKYAEHPYVRGTHAGFTFDVVPAYAVPDAAQKMSAVDRSPFHLEYVRTHLKAAQRDEVRLLKQFLKGIGAYGAETSTAGFSGYLAELLVMKFGTFWDALVGLRGREPPIELSLSGPVPPLGGPLVFVDPVDVRRNAAAAVSKERLQSFLRAAAAFTERPGLEFFWPPTRRPLNRAAILERLAGRGAIGLVLPAPTVREDARVPHLRRFADKVSRFLEDEGFRVVRHAVEPVSARRFVAFFEHEPRELPDRFRHRGPRAEDKSHADRFLEKWKAHPDALAPPRLESGRWTVEVRRTRRSASQLLAPALARLLEGLDLPAASKRRLKPVTLDELAKRPELRAALTRFVAPTDPWERA